MAHQAFLNPGVRAAATAARAPDGLMDDVGSFGGDLAALAALQSRLAAADARESLARAAPAVAGLFLAVLLCVAAAVAAAAGLALWLAERYAVALPTSLMLVSLGAMVLAAILGFVSARILGSSVIPFRRSAEELGRNVAWVKTTLAHSGR